MDTNLRNILVLAVAFQLLLGAFLTMSAIEKSILQSVYEEDSSFNGDGFICLALIHIFFGIANFLGPSVVAAFGAKRTLVVSTVFYAGFIASFHYPKAWIIYVSSSLMGIAAGCLWVANGVYFTKCSTEKTINRNMGIYWTVQSSGIAVGNALVFWRFQGVSHIDSEMRFWVISIITAVSGMATLTLCFLGVPVSDSPDSKKDKSIEDKRETVAETLSKSFKLLSDKHMLLLIPPSLYSGFEAAVFSGIYPAAIGFSEAFGVSEAKKYMGLTGILIGIGTMLAGVIFGVVGSKIFKSSRLVGVMVAGLAHCTACVLIYANLATSSTLGPTKETSLITPPSVLIAVACAFLLGIGDGCLMPQICAAVAAIWTEDPSAGYAMFRFFQGGMIGLVFTVGTMTGLHNLLFAFMATAIIGTFSFCLNERLISRKVAQYSPKKFIGVPPTPSPPMTDKQMIMREEQNKKADEKVVSKI